MKDIYRDVNRFISICCCLFETLGTKRPIDIILARKISQAVRMNLVDIGLENEINCLMHGGGRFRHNFIFLFSLGQTKRILWDLSLNGIFFLHEILLLGIQAFQN